MPATVILTRIAVDSEKRSLMAKLYASPEFILLKEIIVAHAIQAQVEAMNTILYAAKNPNAKEDADREAAKAGEFNLVLDILDDLGSKEDEWFTVKLEPRR